MAHSGWAHLALALSVLVATTAGRRLGKPVAEGGAIQRVEAVHNSSTLAQNTTVVQGNKTEVVAVHNTSTVVQNTTGVHGNKSALVARKARHGPASEEQQLAGLRSGLEAIRNLRATFTAAEPAISGDAADMQKMAQGAMTTELQKKDSTVWVAIDEMLSAANQAMVAMKNASNATKGSIMQALEGTIDSRAQALRNATDRAGREQEKHSEEYLLGLLMQHQQDWSVEKQLNVTRDFSHDCPIVKQLLSRHRAGKPLAPQLAALMDSRTATETKAKGLFLQLADSMRRA